MSVRRMFRAASLLPVWIACAASSAAPTTFSDCRDCPPMVIIPGGTFTMGSPPTEPERRRFEGPQPDVTVATFAIGETEVTRAQYAAFVKDTKRTATEGCFTYGFSGFRDDTAIDMKASWRNPGFEQTPEHPVVCISWEDARDYAAWLARKTGRPYRLPSEAEWEYAARAGTTTVFFWGNAEELGCDYMNGGDPTLLRALPQLHEEIAYSLREGDAGARYVKCNDGSAFTSPVRRYRPNAFGLYDIIGNAWEFVEDCWHESLPTSGLARVAGPCEFRRSRGGSWDDFPEELRSARRSRVKPNTRGNYAGFRVARTLSTDEAGKQQ
jgi:formylglycine-generating enzyme required for sulfatase activity